MESIIALHGSIGQRHQHGLPGNMGQGYQYGLQREPAPQTSTWPQVTAKATMMFRMAFAGNTGQAHPLQWENGPRHDPWQQHSNIF